MESFGIELITNGGAVAVLFVIMLLGFAWCYFKIKSIEIAADGSKLGTGTGSVIHVDDFNIQDSFSGQQIQAVLEAEIEFSA